MRNWWRAICQICGQASPPGIWQKSCECHGPVKIVSAPLKQGQAEAKARPHFKPRSTVVKTGPQRGSSRKVQPPQQESPLVLDSKRRAERFGHLRHEGREQSRTAQMKAMIHFNPYYA